MASQKTKGSLIQEALAGKEAALPRTLLSELLELPAARSFPPLAGFKRGREPAAAGERWLADASAGLPLKGSQQLDPTGLLLVEAANQLSALVKQQLQRRMLRAVRGSCGAASDSDSDADGGAGGKEAGGCDSGSGGPGSPRGIHAGGAAGTGSTSACTASAGPSLGASAPSSAPISLPRCKRICLERQFAIDFSGHCLMGGERVLLPPAESLTMPPAADRAE